MEKYNDKQLKLLNNTSIVINAAVTAYARIHMNKFKLDILKQGGKLYYSDTDSIVTDIELHYFLINSNKLDQVSILNTVSNLTPFSEQ